MHLVHPPRFSIKLESNPPDAFAETGFVKHNVPIAGCRPAVPALQLKQADVICPCTTCGIVGSPSLALCRSCFRTYCSLARSRTSCSLAAPAPSLLPPALPHPFVATPPPPLYLLPAMSFHAPHRCCFRLRWPITRLRCLVALSPFSFPPLFSRVR